MAAKGHSFAERVARWQVLADNLKETEGLTHIVADQEQLDRDLAEARTLEARLDDLRSQSQTVTARMRKLANEGDKLRSRIGANLHGKYGFTSETLIRFGLKPRRVPRRSKKEKKPETTPATVTTSAAEAPPDGPAKDDAEA